MRPDASCWLVLLCDYAYPSRRVEKMVGLHEAKDPAEVIMEWWLRGERVEHTRKQVLRSLDALITRGLSLR